eukprot:scaffold54682_cov31-Tisochrysis_lutea.AAC.1
MRHGCRSIKHTAVRVRASGARTPKRFVPHWCVCHACETCHRLFEGQIRSHRSHRLCGAKASHRMREGGGVSLRAEACTSKGARMAWHLHRRHVAGHAHRRLHPIRVGERAC